MKKLLTLLVLLSFTLASHPQQIILDSIITHESWGGIWNTKFKYNSSGEMVMYSCRAGYTNYNEYIDSSWVYYLSPNKDSICRYFYFFNSDTTFRNTYVKNRLPNGNPSIEIRYDYYGPNIPYASTKVMYNYDSLNRVIGIGSYTSPLGGPWTWAGGIDVFYYGDDSTITLVYENGNPTPIKYYRNIYSNNYLIQKALFIKSLGTWVLYDLIHYTYQSSKLIKTTHFEGGMYTFLGFYGYDSLGNQTSFETTPLPGSKFVPTLKTYNYYPPYNTSTSWLPNKNLLQPEFFPGPEIPNINILTNIVEYTDSSGVWVKKSNIDFYYNFNVGVNSIVRTQNLKTYPNPTEGLVSIEGELDYVDVFNMTGQLMLTSKSNILNIEGFPNGIYILAVHKEGMINTTKIIKH